MTGLKIIVLTTKGRGFVISVGNGFIKRIWN
jgi:hypothetical protein